MLPKMKERRTNIFSNSDDTCTMTELKTTIRELSKRKYRSTVSKKIERQN